MANELTDEGNVNDIDSTKAANLDEQVEKRMQRLNLYFEKENVSHTHVPIHITINDFISAVFISIK